MTSTTGAARPAFRMLLCAAAVCACFSQASATSILIVNPSFEAPVQSPGGSTASAPTGWNATGTVGVWYPLAGTFFSAIPPDQNQIVYLTVDNGPASLSQTLTDFLLPNTTYTLRFYAGLQNDHGTSDYTVSLLAGTTVLASDTNGALTAGHFAQRSFTYQTGASPTSGALGIRVDVPVSQVVFDAFTLDASANSAVPEPGTLGFTLVSTVLMAYLRTRTIRARREASAAERVV